MLWFKGRVIRTTDEHPFWADGKGWTTAGELKAGDNLLASDKSKLPVENVSETGDTETVYNFRVADWHTYFVGNEDWGFEVWVHNACGPGANGPTPNNIKEYLKDLHGKSGKTGPINTVSDAKLLDDFFNSLTSEAKVVNPKGYPGILKELPGGTIVRLRPGSKSGGAAIDIAMPGGQIIKVHIQWPTLLSILFWKC
jgi:hypothetical protein